MKRIVIFSLAFLFIGIIELFPQDLIILKNGQRIEAKVLEVSSTVIKYNFMFDVDGIVLSIPTHRVRSIKYNDKTVIRNEQRRQKNLAKLEQDRLELIARIKHENQIIEQYDISHLLKNEPSVKESEKMIFGINANAGGLIPLGNTLVSGGPSINLEFIKNNFYSMVNISMPIQDNIGFGFLGIFNYLGKSRIGDFYLGGGLGYIYHNFHFFTFGVNAGYRYVTSFGMHFNAGAYIGGKLNDGIDLDIRPVLGIGYSF